MRCRFCGDTSHEALSVDGCLAFWQAVDVRDELDLES